MRVTGHGGAAAAWLAVVLFAGLLVSLPGRSIAETVVRSEVDSRRVGVQDVLQFTITVEGSSLPDQVPLPALTNLRLGRAAIHERHLGRHRWTAHQAQVGEGGQGHLVGK